MDKYCLNCKEQVQAFIVDERETYPVKGQPIEIIAKVCKCKKCEQSLWDDEIDEKNLEKAFNEYRRKNGLLMPDEIKRTREKYGVSQVNFARILGVGDKTIARYESGNVQDEAINNLIMLVKDKKNFRTLFNKNKDKLPAEERKRLEKMFICSAVTTVYETTPFFSLYNKHENKRLEYRELVLQH